MARRRRRFSRRLADLWFATLIRYAGLVVMMYAALIDRGKNPALIPAATGMICLKTLYGGDDRQNAGR